MCPTSALINERQGANNAAPMRAGPVKRIDSPGLRIFVLCRDVFLRGSSSCLSGRAAVWEVPDLVDRDFVASAPNRCWVADFTYVKTWSTIVYVAFVVDTFSRRIVGWSAATVKETVFVLDALEMAVWQRDRDQRPIRAGELSHHSDAGSPYTSFRLAEYLDAAGTPPPSTWSATPTTTP
ncbi:DDE-type integrase/transposase/recombinase [Streptomyces viridosporus]